MHPKIPASFEKEYGKTKIFIGMFDQFGVLKREKCSESLGEEPFTCYNQRSSYQTRERIKDGYLS
ncbi:MAG: hypothetical protein A2Z14_09985 [Chloroflexi bacterium RBG_16_48_8]|nr:MAG: hypothetical protein A2Z14_09985 [Chloroflexi bacterium RBG_16_48_8]